METKQKNRLKKLGLGIGALVLISLSIFSFGNSGGQSAKQQINGLLGKVIPDWFDPFGDTSKTLGIKSGTNLYIDNVGGGYQHWEIENTDPDQSTTNELQTLSQSGSTISLSNGGGSVNAGFLPSAVNNNVSRSIVTANNAANGFQISSTKGAFGSYSVTITATASGLVAGASSGYVVYEMATTNSTNPASWTEIGRWTNGQTFTSVLTLSSSQPVGSDITKYIPSGNYVRLRKVDVSGTVTATLNSNQEIIL